MQRASTFVAMLSAAGSVFVDSFRDAYVSTGMNLVQSLIVCAVDLGRRCVDASRNG
jgi:hypothetical protein